MKSDKCLGCSPAVIFDSRKAKSAYAELPYYRSAAFDVPGGYVAVIEMTAHADDLCNMRFEAIRVPTGEGALSECLDSSGVGKRYRRWRCCKSLGSSDAGGGGGATENTPYNRSVVRWGWDHLRQEIVEFEYIVRPGRYYLIGDKRFNERIENCEHPTIFEMTLLPVSSVPDLALDCCPGDD